MKIGPLNRFAVVGVVLTVLLVNLQLATSQSQQRVQSTTQLSVRTPVVADPMADWEQAYAEAMAVAQELTTSGNVDHGQRITNDLEELDRALREYVRASERLRHKNRAMEDTMEFMSLQLSQQNISRMSRMMSNLHRAMRDIETSFIDNLR